MTVLNFICFILYDYIHLTLTSYVSIKSQALCKITKFDKTQVALGKLNKLCVVCHMEIKKAVNKLDDIILKRK